MIKKTHWLCKILFCIFLFLSTTINGQINVKVKVLTVEVLNNIDSDNGFLGIGNSESDFVIEYIATDNVIGNTNNNPVFFGFLGDFNYAFVNDNNGAWIRNSPSTDINPNDGIFFNHDYLCQVPTTINIEWQGYENDAGTNYDLTGGFFSDLETGAQTGTIDVPASGNSIQESYQANGGGQTYKIIFEVITTPLSVQQMQNNICNALNIPVDNISYRFAYCNSNNEFTNEIGEPIFQSVANPGHGSAWFYFTLPANSSGNIRIDTDLNETSFGTEFALYHAADGFGCSQGTNNFNNLLIKNKFNYLSEHSYADDDIPIISPQALATGNWDGGLLFSEGDPLIPGETYYIQFNTDAANQQGSVGIRITDLGGTPTPFNDIPCTSPILPGSIPTTTISSENTNAASPNLTLNYSNATDREAGSNFTNTNAENYVAYTYSPPSGTTNSIDENVWFNFTAPNSGRVYFEGEVTGLFGISEAEDIALYALDERFAPGQPIDLFCSNLTQIDASAGSVSGSNRTAKINATCLEPGYTYYGMLDPSGFSTVSNGKIWMYDPSVTDPSFNAPGNDILCLAITDTLYEVPVILAGTNPTFQAVAGSNVRACREYLAGEPSANSNENLRADQTVWHYFVAPSSGAVEMSIRAFIGMDTLRYNIFELLNGTDCYGGLNPATYTQDGTQATPLIQPIISGTAGFSGTQQSACCLIPGKVYAIQIDGGSPGDEGQYIIEYIQEIDSDAGDIYVELANGDSLTIAQQDTAFVCFGESVFAGITVNGIGQSTQSLPDCLSPGYVIHSYQTVSDPIANTGFELSYIDYVTGLTASYMNDGDGSGSFGNPEFNTLYYISPAGDITADWGDFTCGTSTVSNGLPIVFLESLNADFDYDNASCTAIFSATGGLNGYYDNPYTYTIVDPAGQTAFTGQLSPGVPATYLGSIAGIYSVIINDGACPQTFTFDATNCNNPCTDTTITVSTSICEGSSIVLGGVSQTTAGEYTDNLTSAQGCDSIVVTTLSIIPIAKVIAEHSICPGGSLQVGTSTYSSAGVYLDTLTSTAGCDSIVTSVVFMLPTITTNTDVTICSGSTYNFNGVSITDEGVYTATLTTAAGCDSVVVLSLFVTPPTSSYESVEICSNENYTFAGQNLNISGIYTDTLTTSSGCDSVLVLELSVLDCDFEISNILTPNDDGQNDTWKVSDVNKIFGCEVKIYNRWGELVYKTNDYNNEWGGTRNNELLPDGVYFYSIKCSDKEYTGEINLLRFKK